MSPVPQNHCYTCLYTLQFLGSLLAIYAVGLLLISLDISATTCITQVRIEKTIQEEFK